MSCPARSRHGPVWPNPESRQMTRRSGHGGGKRRSSTPGRKLSTNTSALAASRRSWADPAADLGELGEMSLTELVIKTGIHDAIARKLNAQGTLSRNAIAEGIINNVRKTIIRDQLTDPRFYEHMSKLLDDLIKQSRADAAA